MNNLLVEQIIQDMNNLLAESRWRNRKSVEEDFLGFLGNRKAIEENQILSKENWNKREILILERDFTIFQKDYLVIQVEAT
jgi:hypothetical protein